jgi:hypothetical protein
MARIAFLLMAHRNPGQVIAQARALTRHGDFVAIHFDKRAPSTAFDEIRTALADAPGVTFAKRVKCGWGEYSLIQASLNLIRAARSTFDGITHYYLMSGDCYPIKTRGYFDEFLTDDTDHIEAQDFFESAWIRTGIKEERLTYRHWFNERKYKDWFYWSLNMQRRFGLSRPLPEGLKIRIGSQWWALRASTIESLLAFLDKRRDIARFFRTTWIPDETFFQTLVYHMIPRDQISQKPPTHFMFTDYGIPVVFHDDHMAYLRGRQRLMARKISSDSTDLREQLLEVYRVPERDPAEGQSDGGIYPYLAQRGRTGKRYAPRFWERSIRARADAEVLIIAAKVWHIGKAVERRIAEATGVHSLGYVFDEGDPIDLPLGGLEHGLKKRGRHRHALLNIILDTVGTDRLILSVDTSRTDVISDIVSRMGDVRILLVDRPVSHDQIVLRAERAGLIGPASGDFERREVVQALKHEFSAAGGELRQAFSGKVYVNSLEKSRDDNTREIARFLRIGRDEAEPIAIDAEHHVD